MICIYTTTETTPRVPLERLQAADGTTEAFTSE